MRESKNEEDCAREMYKNTLKKLKKLKKSKLYRDKEREYKQNREIGSEPEKKRAFSSGFLFCVYVYNLKKVKTRS